MSRFSAQVLQLAAAHVPDAWLALAERKALLAMAEVVAPLQTLYFECRLTGRGRPVDVSQHFLADDVDSAALLALAERRIAAAPQDDSLWQRVAAFARAWHDNRRSIVEFGLEHDLGVSIPAVFAGVPTGLGEDRDAAGRFLAMLNPVSEPGWKQMIVAINAAQREGLVPGRLIGAMLSRDGQLRCVFRNLAPRPVAAFLSAIDWPGDIPALIDLLSKPVFRTPAARLVLGFGPTPLADCGIEMIYRTPEGTPIRGCEGLINWLIGQDLADRDTQALLAAWSGIITPANARSAWPDALILEDLAQSFASPMTFSATLSHFKLNLAASRPVAAKAYLAFTPTRRHLLEDRQCLT